MCILLFHRNLNKIHLNFFVYFLFCFQICMLYFINCSPFIFSGSHYNSITQSGTNVEAETISLLWIYLRIIALITKRAASCREWEAREKIKMKDILSHLDSNTPLPTIMPMPTIVKITYDNLIYIYSSKEVINAYYFSSWASSHNCCCYLCLVYD